MYLLYYSLFMMKFNYIFFDSLNRFV